MLVEEHIVLAERHIQLAMLLKAAVLELQALNAKSGFRPPPYLIWASNTARA
jgi:hypothetical protein